MAESFRSRLSRWRFNFFPAFRRTGGRLTYVAHDWREVRVRLPLTWATKNYVGTMFGGSLYAATDGQYMVMLMRLLGPAYVVWDKGATIWKDADGTVYASVETTIHIRRKESS